MVKMFLKVAIVCVIALVIIVALGRRGHAQRYYQYAPTIKVSKLGPDAVAIVCLNGADPTGRIAGGVLIVSCAEEAPARK